MKQSQRDGLMSSLEINKTKAASSRWAYKSSQWPQVPIGSELCAPSTTRHSARCKPDSLAHTSQKRSRWQMHPNLSIIYEPIDSPIESKDPIRDSLRSRVLTGGRVTSVVKKNGLIKQAKQIFVLRIRERKKGMRGDGDGDGDGEPLREQPVNLNDRMF